MSDGPGSESVAEIEQQIQETRADLAESIDELTDRLNPATQLHEVVETARTTASTAAAQGQDAARSAVETVREATDGHEREVAIAVVALLVLVLLGRRRRRRRRR